MLYNFTRGLIAALGMFPNKADKYKTFEPEKWSLEKLEQEVELIRQKKSRLSRTQRGIVLNMYCDAIIPKETSTFLEDCVNISHKVSALLDETPLEWLIDTFRSCTSEKFGEVTNDNFWDCECDSDKKYIHFKSQEECTICGAFRDEQPDSMQDEVVEMFKRMLLKIEQEKNLIEQKNSKLSAEQRKKILSM